MRVIAFLRHRAVESAWVAFAGANVAAMLLTPGWETIPFHFIWVSLTIVYGFRTWRLSVTSGVLAAVAVATGVPILADAFQGSQLWGELFEVPLMSAMFLAMVWHARRRQDAVVALEGKTAELHELLSLQERLLHDVSHELRTPIQIARGHIELLARANGDRAESVGVALDELGRMERITERVLLLAKAEKEGALTPVGVELELFLEDVFMRWAEIAPRSWRLGELARGTLEADPEALRIALDALLENAVKYTDTGDPIELSTRVLEDGVIAIVVADEGCGVPTEAREQIFERFARADAARSRDAGGVGLGLAIADAIARAHNGRCSLLDSDGAAFALVLPGFRRRDDTDAEELDAQLASPAHAGPASY